MFSWMMKEVIPSPLVNLSPNLSPRAGRVIPATLIMTRTLAILALFAALIYGAAAYTRPHEPAGRALHDLLDSCTIELPKLPFSGLLNWNNGYQSRPTAQPLEVVSPDAAGYSPEELSEIYPTH